MTTPKEWCSDPLANPVKTVPAILDAGAANLSTAAAFTGKSSYMIPLTLALVYAVAHREELERIYDGNQVFARAIGDLFGSGASGVGHP